MSTRSGAWVVLAAIVVEKLVTLSSGIVSNSSRKESGLDLWPAPGLQLATADIATPFHSDAQNTRPSLISRTSFVGGCKQ